VGLVISGGNIDLPILSAIIQRGLVRSGRLARLMVEIRDIPGELAKAAGLISDTGANIVQVNHQRIFTGTPLQGAELHFVLQTRGPDHIRELLASLHGQGYRARMQGAGQE
jgi:threonine dehydratase